MFDSHTHTEFSKDCTTSARALCEAAQKRGLDGVCFTDHCSLLTCISDNAYRTVFNSVAEARRMDSAFENFTVAGGGEFSGILQKRDYFERILSSVPLDCVLVSVHHIFDGCMPVGLSHMDFSRLSFTRTEETVHTYFKDLHDTLSFADFDVCAHLTLPFRYINGVYNKSLPVNLFQKDICGILALLIERKKALELNCSELDRQLFDFMPCESVLGMYRDMGGTLITLGSDAHTADAVGKGFSRAARLLKGLGFEYTVYYRNRSPVKILL